jgi:CubicO group peptidase (beta-lactamase class C family)
LGIDRKKSSRRTQTWLALIVLAGGLLIAAIGGLWAYMSATATPLHPDPRNVPSVTHSVPSPVWADSVEQGRQIARAGLIEQNLPGLSVAVGVGGQIVWAEGFGWADLGSHELDFTGNLAQGDALKNKNHVDVSPDTRFRIVGVSMALTSAAVGLLVEKGRLKLDDEIQTYVPAFPKKEWPVTLRQLMAHVAGVVNDGGDDAPLLARCERTLDALQEEDRFAERPLLFEPGTRYRYSTYGWIVVSAAVEAAANETFFRFMRSQIFEPLRMDDTLPESWTEPIPNRATSYHPRFAADTRYGPDLVGEGDHSCFSGAGAFLSTPSDLVRFGMAMSGGKLLQPAIVKVLQTPQRLASGEETTSGLGWRLETIPLAGEPARLARQDDRRSVGGTTSLLTFPERGLVVAVTSNITFADTSAVAVKIAQVFAEQGRSSAHRE